MANKFRFRSIRKKLFFQAIIGVIIFAVIAMILNVLVMKPFYISQKKNTMLNSLEDISSLNLEELNNETAFNEVRKIERQYDITIFWFDHDGEIIYLSNQAFINANGSGGAFSSNQLGRGIGLRNPNIRPNPIYIDENTVIYETNDDPSKNNQGFQNSEMVLVSILGDDSEITLRYRLQSFGDAIGLFNMFLLGAAGISIIISVFLSLFMARRFTEPIFEMNNAAKAMANNDFSQVSDVNTGDELQQLSGSINSLNNSLKVSINDLKDTNKQLEIELEKQKRLDNLRQRFVSTVSHELRTPISLIQGYSYGLKSNITDNTEKRDFYTDTIIDESQRMSDLVDDLLDLSQMESGYLKLNIEDFSSHKWLDEMHRKYENLSKSQNKRLVMDNVIDINVHVKGDKKRLEQVFGNFLTNAIRHSDTPDITIKSRELEHVVEISVINKGRVLTDDEQINIWQNFYRVDDDRSREGGGHGLGLAIVKNIQDGHGQEYGCRSTNVGMEFWFNIKKA